MAFLDIVKSQRKQGSGILSSLGAASQQSSLEKMDPRNRLFKSGGILNALFPNVKGYQATDKKSPKIGSSPSALSSVDNVAELSVQLNFIGKNTLVLPSMARDMYLVKQNIIKLVNFQKKGSAQEKSGDWFSRQQARESAYESKFSKSFAKSSKSPSKVDGKDSKSGGGILSIIGSVAMGFGGFLTTLGAASTLLLGFGSILTKLLGWLIKSPIGVLLGLGALAGAKNLSENGGGSSIMNDVVKSDTTKTVVDTAAGVGGALAAAGAVSGASKLVGAAKASGSAVLDARTMSVGQLANSKQTTTWGKFLAFVAKKSPNLWGRVGLKLAQAGALATIPIVGWIGAAIQLGFSLWTAWEIYELWKEFNNARDEAINSPEQIKTTPATTVKPGISLTGESTPQTTPSKMSGSSDGGSTGGLTFNQLSREQQDALLAEQRKQEGFKPGSLTYDLNNPGAIQYSEKAKQFGGVRDTTGRGDAAHKGTFAKFPTLEAGIEAQRDLWSRKYGDMPIQQALKKWAPFSNSNYSQNIMAAATSDKPASSLAQSKPSSGSQLNSYTSALADSQRESSNKPVVINAPTTNVSNGGGGSNSVSLPSSGVIDMEFAKLLVERAIG